MKTHLSQHKAQQKPIKYKQFIQQLQNSSRSSIQDQSLLSQRSFRQSYTARDFQDHLRNQTGKKTSQKSSPFKLNDVQSSYKIAKPSTNQKDEKRSDLNDKLYTFCDAKLTQRSIQIVNHSNSKTKTDQTVSNRQGQNQKYFKTNKRNEQKENIDFVNQILQKMQSGGFQGKVIKTQNSQLENLQKSTKKSPEPIMLMKTQSAGSTAITQPSNNLMTQSSSSRKIQSVKKIFVMTRQSSNKVSNKKINNTNYVSQEKSRENSIRKIQPKTQAQKQSQQKCSSKKKIVSLNINPLKNSVNLPNNIRLKLSLDKSSDRHNQQKQKSFYMETRTNFNLSGRGSLFETKMLSSSMQKMPSLDQSKIETLHQGSRSNLLMSGAQLSQLTNLLPKQSTPNQQVYRLRKTVDEYKENQKKMSKQIYELNQKLKYFNNGQDKREVQIMQKDCARLTNSYKEMKKLYQLTNKQKEQLQSHMQTLIGENNDLKECLDFKSHQLNQLNQKIHQMSQNIHELQQELENRVFPSQLQGLSDIIKEKLTQYEAQISSLLDENHKLTLLRQKLLNYNQTLKDQIEEKDNLIESLQRHVKDISNLKRSCKDQIGDYRQNEMRLNKLCKQLQSKLKLANMHNEYLTQEIVTFKQERKKLMSSNTEASNNGQTLTGRSPNHKLENFNTLGNTMTTRNSSIGHGKDQFDHFLHRIKRDKLLQKQNYYSSDQLQ